MRWSISKTSWIAALLAAAVSSSSCSDGGTIMPTGPTSAGKAVVREQAVDGEGIGIPGAQVLVDGEPTEILTDGEGFFTVTLDPGPHLLEAAVAGETVWSKEVLVEEEGEEPPGEPLPGDGELEEVSASQGIGRCVSECTHTYNPSKRDPLADDLFEGKFNARHCVEFCKDTGYPGGYSPGADGQCHPFYTASDPDCGGADPGENEPPAGGGEEAGDLGAGSQADGKPGNGRGRPDRG